MSFCPNCGKEVADGAQFCASCGASLKPAAPVQGGEVRADGGARSDTAAQAEKVIKAAGRLFAVKASDTAGEFVAGSCSEPSVPTPVKVIVQGVKKLISSIKTVIRNPKQLLPVIILTVLWLIVDLLPALDINPFPVSVLSFLSFGHAGISRDAVQVFGGAFGKGIFAGFVISLITTGPVNAVKSLFESIIKKPKDFCKKYFAPGKGVFVFYVSGILLAVLLFSSMAPITAWSLCGGIAATTLSGKAVCNNGFLSKLIRSIFGLLGKKKVNERTTGFLKGITTGFGLSTLVGLFLGKVQFGESLMARNIWQGIAALAIWPMLILMLLILIVEFFQKKKGGAAV